MVRVRTVTESTGWAGPRAHLNLSYPTDIYAVVAATVPVKVTVTRRGRRRAPGDAPARGRTGQYMILTVTSDSSDRHGTPWQWDLQGRRLSQRDLGRGGRPGPVPA